MSAPKSSWEFSAKLFEPSDLPMLVEVIQLVPDLAVVAYSTKLAQQKLTFPVVDHAGLQPLFEPPRPTFDGRDFIFEDALKHVPAEFFPMESIRDFTVRIAIALQRGRAMHEAEQAAAAAKKTHQEPHVRLPSPVPHR
ncbi:MAG TPA: hypothetical protein VFU36_15750 [Jatrophihabitans sp.]|nr:hypothetical protein [Jatrophihabitans sp.]